jgi:hypothetical protein
MSNPYSHITYLPLSCGGIISCDPALGGDGPEALLFLAAFAG